MAFVTIHTIQLLYLSVHLTSGQTITLVIVFLTVLVVNSGKLLLVILHSDLFRFLAIYIFINKTLTITYSLTPHLHHCYRGILLLYLSSSSNYFFPYLLTYFTRLSLTHQQTLTYTNNNIYNSATRVLKWRINQNPLFCHQLCSLLSHSVCCLRLIFQQTKQNNIF